MNATPGIHPLAAARQKARVSLRKLGAISRVSYVTISHIENGRVTPLPETMARLANALSAYTGRKVSAESLYPVEIPRNPSPAEREALIDRHDWSTEPSDEYGGYSEAEWQLSYAAQDPATWSPLTIVGADGDTQREEAPDWFRSKVEKVRGAMPPARIIVTRPLPRRDGGRASRPGARRAKRASSTADADDGPGEPSEQRPRVSGRRG
jgi:transcriptional regulator with XRE-family HTH domain